MENLFEKLWVSLVAATLTLLAILPFCARATTYRIEFTSPMLSISSIGVLANGAALTSGVPMLGEDGVWYLDTHVLYGTSTTIVAFDRYGNVSLPSNARTYGGCDWDLDGDGLVSLVDFSIYRSEYAYGDAELVELGSFRAAFGRSCN